MTMDAKDAKAEAKAAKARAKALRPWYRKKRIGLLAIVGLIVIIVISTSGSSAPKKSSASSSGDSGSQVPTASNSTPGIGDPAADGDFSFVVKSVSCGQASDAAVEGSFGLGETVPAGAQECLVTTKITDVKGSGQTYFSGNQYAYDAAGRKFNADPDGAIYLTGDNDNTQVNPGITITAIIPFQIPSTDKIAYLELHDSAFSGGVKVKV